jgi:hypothetical protein
VRATVREGQLVQHRHTKQLVSVLIHVGVAPQARTLLQSVFGHPPLAVSMIAGPANTLVLVLQDAVTARLVSSQETLVPVRVCLLIHVGVVIRQILHHNKSDRLCRLRCR